MKTTLIPLLLTLATSLAHADEQGYSKAYDTCMDTASTTAAMVDCLAQETKVQDTRLNANYQALVKNLDTERLTKLRDAQRSWVKFRDADCALARIMTGGSIDRVNAQSCLLQATKAWADNLAVLLSPEG